MKRKNLLFSMLFVLLQVAVFAQGRVVKGTITDSKTKETLPGVTILVEGTTTATSTNINGEFTITVPEGKKLVISSIGFVTKTVDANQDVINVSLDADSKTLGDVVVTALGISRDKKSLGYATQEISGDKLAEVKSGNFVNQISGKVAGVQIKNSGNLGGSTNVIVRGTTSMLFNNQALFVVDGVPINNETTSGKTTNGTQSQGGSGYDYGSPVSDINPEDIESMNVLKGAAATALYGSRAANGVVMITTKKGKLSTSSRPRFGVTLNSNVTVGVVDKSTFPTYQNEYGAGYGPYYGSGPGGFFLARDVNQDGTVTDDEKLVVPYTQDASMGGKFDPSLMVYQWDAFVPESKNYRKATPWVGAGDNGPITFFRKAVGYTNGVNVDGGNDKGSFRLSYANTSQTGILPNSSLKRNNLGFNGGIQLNDRFSASASVNYVRNAATGRNSTGYSNNELSNFRQWWQTNVNVVEQKEIYEQTKANYGWNAANFRVPLVPIYWDNVYFQRNESFTTDERDRVYGNAVLNYKVNDIISLMGRVSLDQYATIQEERLAQGSVAKQFGVSRANSTGGYLRYNKNYRENNYDLMVNFKKDFGENLNLTGLVGTNIRRTYTNSIFASTNGGLVVPKLYSIANSKETPSASIEEQTVVGVNGYYASASLGYKRFLYLDVTARQDYSSTLPVGKNGYFYPGVSGSFLFSEKIKTTWMDFGKLRLNYAQVGSDAQFANITDVYAKPIAFGQNALFSIPNAKNNSDLKSEKTLNTEAGLEMIFFKKRLGFDLAVYKKSTIDQVVPVAVSYATGYSSKFVNAGTVENKGIELNLYGTPFQTQNFKWLVNLNFAKNVSKVAKLFEGIENLQLANFQGGVTLNATLGEPYGTLKGTDYVYLNGKKVVDADGFYKKTETSDNVLGNINPDFNLGLTNTFTYKNLSLSFLIDAQKGGDVYSLDMYYGLSTGLYPETVGNNDLGNPKRSPIAEGGGIIFDGVTETGEVNTKRVEANTYEAFGYEAHPDKEFIYDASYIKLREISLSYRVPFKKESFLSSATFGIVANNVWILFKNLPYADPEAGLGAGNIQGFQTGVMPTTRNFGFNLTLQF